MVVMVLPHCAALGVVCWEKGGRNPGQCLVAKQGLYVEVAKGHLVGNLLMVSARLQGKGVASGSHAGPHPGG